MVTRCITIIIITCYGTSPQVTIVTSSSHVWSTNTWALAPKSPIYCPRSILSFSDNSFKYPNKRFSLLYFIFFYGKWMGLGLVIPLKLNPVLQKAYHYPWGTAARGPSGVRRVAGIISWSSFSNNTHSI